MDILDDMGGSKLSAKVFFKVNNNDLITDSFSNLESVLNVIHNLKSIINACGKRRSVTFVSPVVFKPQ